MPVHPAAPADEKDENGKARGPAAPGDEKDENGKARGVRTINTIAKHPGMLVGATDTFTLCSPIGTGFHCLFVCCQDKKRTDWKSRTLQGDDADVLVPG